jgi:hypothetical protein
MRENKKEEAIKLSRQESSESGFLAQKESAVFLSGPHQGKGLKGKSQDDYPTDGQSHQIDQLNERIPVKTRETIGPLIVTSRKLDMKFPQPPKISCKTRRPGKEIDASPLQVTGLERRANLKPRKPNLAGSQAAHSVPGNRLPKAQDSVAAFFRMNGMKGDN